jgi:hypothetical protein
MCKGLPFSLHVISLLWLLTDVFQEHAGLAFIQYVQENLSIRWRYGANLGLRMLDHFFSVVLFALVVFVL